MGRVGWENILFLEGQQLEVKELTCHMHCSECQLALEGVAVIDTPYKEISVIDILP